MSEENLEEIMSSLEMDEVEYEEIDAYIGSSGLEDPERTEFRVAKQLAEDVPEIFEEGEEVYVPSSVLKRYKLEGELPEGSEIILESGEPGNYETKLDNDHYNIKVRPNVNPMGLRRIL